MFARNRPAPARLAWTPPSPPVQITPGMAQHVLNLVVEYGGLVRQEAQFEHLAGDDQFGAHRENAKHARAMQATYYVQIQDLLTKGTL
jgi:hypothetical protein